MAFPLQDVTIPELKDLCQALWDWKLCGNCQEDIQGRPSPSRRCPGAEGCPWGQKSERLGPFFDFYREVTGSYVPDFFGEEDQALRDHQDLFDIIRLLRRCGFAFPRGSYMREYFVTRSNGSTMVPESDQGRAFDLAARVLTMTNLNGVGSQDFLNQIGGENEAGIDSPPRPVWGNAECLQTAFGESFPSRIHPSLQGGDPQATAIKNSLTAETLRRVARIKIERTNDLRNHLKLDPIAGVVLVFHQTSFLREHLLATKPEPKGSDEEIGDEMTSPCLPRELALETLYTLQLLFPPGGNSQAILRTLVSKQGFDPDSLRFGTALYELSAHERERALRFPIWGTRLMDLYDEIENPKPRGRLDVWLERRSKSRHIMLATAVGIFTAVLLGVLSLCVSIFQAWIAWQEWKESTAGR